jgi:hypothetical protein
MICITTQLIFFCNIVENAARADCSSTAALRYREYKVAHIASIRVPDGRR